MSFFQTEKGKITTGVLAAVIATTAILVPVTIVSDRAIRGDENTSSLSQSIETYSYTATAGTTTNGFGLAGIGNGSNEDTIEYLNKTNSHYHDVLTDPEIIDGVASHDGLGFGNEGIIGSSWKGDNATTHALDLYDASGTIIEDHTYDTPLSINMKVTKDASNVLRDHMYGATEPASALTAADMGEYGTEVVAHNEKTAQQFAVAFGFFNWVTYSKTAKDAEIASGYNTDGLVGTEDDAAIATWWTTTFDDAEWKTSGISGTFQLAVDGSSTVNPAFKTAVDAFNTTYTQFDIMENLNNSGSSNSWGFDPSVEIPGTDGTTNGTASAYTFLGTSSSLQRKDDVLASWGYKDGSALQVKEATGGKEIADIETAVSTPDAILETTIAVDGAPTFFTSADLKVTNPETGNKEQPIGITQEGVQAAYIYGASWESLAFQGEVIFAAA